MTDFTNSDTLHIYVLQMFPGFYSIRDTDDSKIPEPVPSVATTEVDELDEDIYTKPLVLTQGK